MKIIIIRRIFLFLLLVNFSVDVSFAAPKIILKFDDLKVNKNLSCPSIPTMEFLLQKKIKAGFGVIANQIDATALNELCPYLNATDSVGNNFFEFWHHGLDHVQPEFFGTSYAYQKLHFDSASHLIKNFLGIQMHTFGTPFNASDEVTNAVVSEDINYKVFIFSSVNTLASSGILNLNNRVNIENGTGIPDFNYFVTNYNAKKNIYKDYMVLQGHPNYWPAFKIEQLNKIIEFLISEGCEFVLPYDYYRSLTLYPPTNLKINVITGNQINLSWKDNTTSESNYKIERSTDGIIWTLIDTSPENSVSYSDKNRPLSGSIYYRVYANCGIKSDYSNTVHIF